MARFTIYRAKPAPKRIVVWLNVYPNGGSASRCKPSQADDWASSNRICVYRIESNEDGSDPTIEVEDV